MALTGQAKVDYQREYMRKRRARSNTESNNTVQSVRPVTPEPVRPKRSVILRPQGISDNQWAYIQFKEGRK